MEFAYSEALMADELNCSPFCCRRATSILSYHRCRAVLRLQEEHGSFCNYVWSFVPNGQPIVNRWTSVSEVPAK